MDCNVSRTLGQASGLSTCNSRNTRNLLPSNSLKARQAQKLRASSSQGFDQDKYPAIETKISSSVTQALTTDSERDMKKISKAKTISPVEAAIKTIEQGYAIGIKIQKQCSLTPPLGLIAKLADQYGINCEKARKLRAMASEETGYTKEQLDKLFKQFREENNALSISHFIRLISVPKGKDRDRLTQDALTNGWSSHRLQNEIIARRGRRKKGGRKPTVVSGKAFKAELAQTLWAWNRWLELHLEANKKLEPELTKELNSLRSKIVKVNQLIAK